VLASDVVNQLAALLPKYTDKFTDDVEITSITRNSTVMTALCKNVHNMDIGDIFNLLNAPTSHTSSSLTRSGTVGTIVFTTDHDLTDAIVSTIEIVSASESEFVGTFSILSIPNRRTVTFTMADAGPTTANNGVVHGIGSYLQQYDGVYQVTDVLDVGKFTFAHSNASLADPVGTDIIARVKPRISASVDADRAAAAYTQQESDDKFWMFVVLDDVESSKSRHIQSDAVDNIGRGAEYRQQIMQPFSVYVFMPAAAQIAGRAARDEAENLFQPICKSLLFSKFDSGLFAGAQGPVHFVRHGLYNYDTAIYVHVYAFEQVVDIVVDDTVGDELDVAFRNIDFTLYPQLDGTGFMTAGVDLDEEEL
jgi:hypothetical protein